LQKFLDEKKEEEKKEKKEEKKYVPKVKKLSPEEEIAMDEKADEKVQESLKPKPEAKPSNVQDEYDAKFTLAKDAEKSAPPSHDSIEYTIKNGASKVEHD